MANTPKKMKDPTEAALSAIQDALQIRDDSTTQPSTTTPSSPTASEPADKPWPGLRKPTAKAPDTSFKAPVPYEDESLRADDGGMRRPANDDRESIGTILRALQQTPSRTSYVLASV